MKNIIRNGIVIITILVPNIKYNTALKENNENMRPADVYIYETANKIVNEPTIKKIFCLKFLIQNNPSSIEHDITWPTYCRN